MFDRLSTAPKRSPAFEERNAFVKLTIAVVCGGEQWTVRIEDGRVEAKRRRPPSADLIFSASSEDWKKYALTEQPRGFTAIAAMQRTGALTVEGDMMLFHRHNSQLKRCFARCGPTRRRRRRQPRLPRQGSKLSSGAI